MPIESSYRVQTDPDGSVHYLHSLYREGSEKDWKHEISRAAYLSASNRQTMGRLLNDVSRRRDGDQFAAGRTRYVDGRQFRR